MKKRDFSLFGQKIEQEQEKRIALELASLLVDLIEKKGLSYKEAKPLIEKSIVSYSMKKPELSKAILQILKDRYSDNEQNIIA